MPLKGAQEQRSEQQRCCAFTGKYEVPQLCKVSSKAFTWLRSRNPNGADGSDLGHRWLLLHHLHVSAQEAEAERLGVSSLYPHPHVQAGPSRQASKHQPRPSHTHSAEGGKGRGADSITHRLRTLCVLSIKSYLMACLYEKLSKENQRLRMPIAWQAAEHEAEGRARHLCCAACAWSRYLSTFL